MSPSDDDKGVVATYVTAKAKSKGLGYILGLLASPVVITGFIVLVVAIAVAIPFVQTGGAGGGTTFNCLIPGNGTVAPTPIQINTAGLKIGNSPLTEEQARNAAVVIGVGLARTEFSFRDITISIMMGIQESRLQIDPKGQDLDSGGIFQERPSQGWGSLEQVLDPVYASNKMYDHMATIPNRDSLPMLEVAIQTLRPSRDAYTSPSNNFMSWQQIAEALVASAVVSGSTTPDQVVPVAVPQCSSSDNSGSPGGVNDTDPGTCEDTGVAANYQVEIAIQAACSVLGTPYIWGGEGENGGFDCSGLVWWAFTMAGFPVGGRTTAAGEYSWPTSQALGENVPYGAFQRGDLVFWANSSSGIHHVAIYLGGGQVVYAPQSGDVVKVGPLYNQDEIIGGVRVAA